MRWTRGRPTIFLTLLVLVSLLDIFAAWAITRKFPTYRYLLIEEDQLVENLSAIFFFLAFLLGPLFILRLRPRRMHWGLAATALVALIGFLDEISFGERLFDLSMPVWGGVKFDAVHDIVELAYKSIRPSPLLWTASVTLASLFIALGLRRLFKDGGGVAKQSLSRFLKTPTFFFVLLFALFIAAAVLIDLHILHTRLLFSLEEVFEMNAAFALFFLCFSLFASANGDGKSTEDKPDAPREKTGERVGTEEVAGDSAVCSAAYRLPETAQRKIEAAQNTGDPVEVHNA